MLGLLATANFRKIAAPLVLLTAYAAATAVADHACGDALVSLTPAFHALLGVLLGLLLVFRTNTAYDRWWEGRKLWGQLVNECRNFAVKIETCVRAEPHDKRELARRLAEFARELKDHLRRGATARSPDGGGRPVHAPAGVVREIYDRIERWRQSEQLGGFELLFLDRHAAALLEICGGCERIRRTPIAPSYRAFIRQSIAIYLVTLPWGLVDLLQFWTVPVTLLVGYLMIGIEVLAEDVEEPFGDGPDDLRLDDLCAEIARSVDELVTE